VLSCAIIPFCIHAFAAAPWKFGIIGDTQAADSLGSYGVDTVTQAAWAVVNYGGDFAIAPFAATLVLDGREGRPAANRPFRLRYGPASCVISVDGPVTGPVSLRISDMRGRTVRVFSASEKNQFTWNYAREGVANGLYVATIRTGASVETVRLGIFRRYS